MIPAQNIIAWGRSVPWGEQRQVEQDLIISRALVELFNDPFLREQLRFRGGGRKSRFRAKILSSRYARAAINFPGTKNRNNRGFPHQTPW